MIIRSRAGLDDVRAPRPAPLVRVQGAGTRREPADDWQSSWVIPRSRPRRATRISRAIRCGRRRSASPRASRTTSWGKTGGGLPVPNAPRSGDRPCSPCAGADRIVTSRNRKRVRTLPRHLGGEIPESRRVSGEGPRGVALLLRLPGGALAEPSDGEPHPVDLRHHPDANGEDQELPEREDGAESRTSSL